MSNFKQYRRMAIAEMADWHEDFDMTGVSVSEPDQKNGYTTLTRSRDGTHRHVGDSGDRPAEAVCRAFLTAVSERGQ